MKTKIQQLGVLAVAFLTNSAAWAAEAGPAAVQKASEDSAPEAVPPAAPAPASSDVMAMSQSVDERLTEIESKAKKAEETVEALEHSVAGLKKLKFSGYVQGCYEWHQDAVDGWENYKHQNRFYVRHGYLGARYQEKYGEFFFQIDGNNSDGLVLKDAEASLIEPWTPLNIKLTIGQFKLPFGYEIGQSDADREMPKRAAVITGIFPGDRDRGLRLQASYDILRLSAALVNGASFGHKDPTDKNGIVQNGYAPNGYKTVVGRLGADLDYLVGGISGMWGRTLETGKNPGKDNYDYTTYTYFEQVRLGADIQGYLDVPYVGGLAIKGEVIWARKKNLDYNDLKASSCRDSRSFGWIVTLAQNVGQYAGVAIRLDQYDPLLSGTVPESCYAADAKPSAEIVAREKDKVTRLGVAGLFHASANTKFILSYEHPWEQSGAKKSNDILTAQLQARF